jgi:enamine deaminase RidA (YjgF/YER057c/UK114 family)
MNQPKFFVTPGYGEYMLNNLHYSQAVKIGDRVEISGQGGWDDILDFLQRVNSSILAGAY